MLDPSCKKCRRSGEKLFLKGDRCFSPKCAFVRRPEPPGIHGKARRRGGISEYGKQLAEKQRLKKIYGLRETQFRKYIEESAIAKGDNREILLRKLEMRLDNVIFRLGWARSRNAARQLVNHGHILVDNRRVNIPSFQVRKDQQISLAERIKGSELFKDFPVLIKKYEPPVWLLLDKEKPEGKILCQPAGEDLGNLASVGLVIEFYSR